ncbi:cytochrome c [Agaricicola taiwanensis]|uniref:Cytochrome c n=1 Tax=Agaricicola taiwanensis TaxID=591372 RepID=A0A8J2YKX1_9RHOB|nr:c-type cytochrome [Agaricicola taiwanensis]GGE49436.1 cytochrome c [Agaricicola taiwanensis]
MIDRLSEKLPPLSRLQRLGVSLAIVVGVLVIAGGVFVLSGTYNIAAGRDHLSVTTWLLEVVRDRSIAARTSNIKAPPLDDPDLIELGARHYRDACSFCHGTPGTPKNPVVAQMLPAPPDLTLSPERYTPEELYWIIENGLKYTGMPAWSAEHRGDEVWSAVAFIMDLHRNGPARYAAIAAEVPPASMEGEEGGDLAPLAECVTCHGDGKRPPVSDLVPSLNGQSRSYLARALDEYRGLVRPSGVMAVAADGLSDAQVEALASYYAGLPDVRGSMSPVEGDAAKGREIALSGFRDGNVPACAACHAGAGRAANASLEGLSASYITGQLNLWRNGERADSGHGAIMMPIAKRLTEQQIKDVAAYYQAEAVAQEEAR